MENSVKGLSRAGMENYSKPNYDDDNMNKCHYTILRESKIRNGYDIFEIRHY